MAFSADAIKHWILFISLISVPAFHSKLGKADNYPSQTGSVGHDPAQIVAKALLCFNEKIVYQSCEEAYRLNENGNINVPSDQTDEYCSGPCLTETYLVLTCIDNILLNFEFYNKATVQDVRDTIHGGCSDTSQRGNFNVTQHIQAEKSNAHKAAYPILFWPLLLMIGRVLISLLICH